MAGVGASLISISPQTQEYNRQIAQEHSLSFEILSDPRNQVAQEFGLMLKIPANVREMYPTFGIDLMVFNNDSSWTVPMPAQFIIDQKGIIRYAEFNPDYFVRPEPTKTLEALKAICMG